MRGNQPNRPNRGVAEPKSYGAGRKDMDVNRERMIFCLTSLVGHRVTAKLRNNAIYEGIFHSCSLDGKFSLTLKCARQLPNEHNKSGEVINTLVIPGNEFLQVSAVDVPPPVAMFDGEGQGGAIGGFAVDGDIAAKRPTQPSREKELVPWVGGAGGDEDGAAGGLEDGGGAVGQWDQFQHNAEMYGIQSTFNEELYTTKLDPDAIPREKRLEAERIAQEIESGQMAADVEDRIDDDDDEERKFSAVGGSGAYRKKDDKGGNGKELAVSGAAAAADGESAVAAPLTKEHLTQHDSLSGDSFGRENRTKRGMITAHSPMRSPMISEMKRINALNLEPALPKLDDKTRNDWINSKQSQTRNASKAVQGNDLKLEFQRSAAEIQKRVDDKERQRAQEGHGSAAGGDDKRCSQNSASTQLARKSEPAGGVTPTGKSSFSFNPKAAEFSFNSSASVFTPGGAAAAPAAAPPAPASAPPAAQMTPKNSSAPNFTTYVDTPQFRPKTLERILDSFFDRCDGERPDAHAPDWPEAQGASYHEVLGQPNLQNPLPPVQSMSGPQAGPMPAWQQGPGQMQQPGAAAQPGAQQQMQQGFVMGQGPGGQAPMYPQMCPQMQQRPQNGGGGPQQQQQMGYQSQMMMVPGQGMPGGMGGQGQNPGNVAMGSVPKFGGQQAPTMMVPMMMPAGQYPGQFVSPQGMQGGGQVPGQPGPQGGGPQQNQMMQQQMYRQHMGPGGPQHQMSGHEG